LAAARGAIDRVVLASDGVANVGLTDADSILRRIDREVGSGIDLVAVGVGMGNFNDVLLEQLANRGNGFYAYVNDRRDADRLFGERLTGTLQTVARDAKVQVEFRSDAIARYRLLGYENRALRDDEFTDPRVDAGEVGAGHAVTAL
jgi:Ca-activated chloride channel homolog